jgi:hypothetical protein
MSQATKGLRVLGVSLLAALGLMAFSAVVAQGAWLESGVEIKENLAGTATIHPLPGTGIVDGRLNVPSQNLEISCSELETKEGKLVTGSNPPLASGTLNFKNCETFQKGKLNKGCKPAEPISSGKIHGVLKLDETNKLTYILILPETGELFTTIDFNIDTCALPDAEIKGNVPSECLNEALETMEASGKDFCLEEMKHHLIQEATNHTLYPGGLKYGSGGVAASITGILDVKLNTGNPFSGHV